MPRYEEAMDLYSKLMHEAGHRLGAMDGALEGKTGLSNAMICEFCFLQLRMLCELVALGCLTAHGDVVTGKLKGTWQADKMIHDLQALHPDFYPKSATRTEARIELQDEGFTKEDLLKLYWRCGDVLHRGTVKTLWSRDGHGDDGIEEIRDWKGRIEALLSDHAIFMADGNTVALFKLRETKRR